MTLSILNTIWSICSVEKIADPCQIAFGLEVFGGKWKGVIIYWIKDEARRFNELKRLIPGITQRTLTNQLRELERDGIVIRTQYNEIPARVEYSATPLCEELIPIFDKVRDWGRDNKDHITSSREVYDRRQDQR